MRALSLLIVIAGVVGPLWLASGMSAGQTLPAFAGGFVGCLLALLISSRLRRPPEAAGPYVPLQHRVVATAGHYHGGAAVAAGLALLIVWLLGQAVGLHAGYLAWGFACAGILAGLSVFVAMFARRWAAQSRAAAQSGYWPGD